MKQDSVLIKLINRISAQKGKIVLINTHELNEWPVDVVACMKASGLLEKGPPAKSAVCPGCEEACSMSVNILVNRSNKPVAFIFCDKRDDINRVQVPQDYIEHWQCSGYLIAKFVSKILDLPMPHTIPSNATRWKIGVFRGKKHSSHITLQAEESLKLEMAGYSIELTELLFIQADKIKINKRRIMQLIDNPAAGGGDKESASERKQRLHNEVNELKAKGVKDFLKQTADKENITVARLKQILNKK